MSRPDPQAPSRVRRELTQKIAKVDSRLRRLRLRAWHRGTKEMDLILGGFVDAQLAQLAESEILALERLMAENDGDLYFWITGARGCPEEHSGIISRLRAHHGIVPRGLAD